MKIKCNDWNIYEVKETEIKYLHKLMCWDSTKLENVEQLLNQTKIDLINTDPPYWINLKWDNSKRWASTSLMKWWLNLKDFKDDTIDYAVEAWNICENLWIKKWVWWWANYYCHHLPQSNNWLVWDKRVEEKMENTNSDCELAYIKWEHSSVRIFRHLWNWLIKASEHWEKRVHPTQKPITLAEHCFQRYDKDWKTVLDLFGWSWSTLIASEKTWRECFMMEFDPHYIQIILKRYHNYTSWEKQIKCLNRNLELNKILWK